MFVAQSFLHVLNASKSPRLCTCVSHHEVGIWVLTKSFWKDILWFRWVVFMCVDSCRISILTLCLMRCNHLAKMFVLQRRSKTLHTFVPLCYSHNIQQVNMWRNMHKIYRTFLSWIGFWIIFTPANKSVMNKVETLTVVIDNVTCIVST